MDQEQTLNYLENTLINEQYILLLRKTLNVVKKR